MPLFSVTFELKSFYDDESLNKQATVVHEIEGDSLDAIYDILDESDYIEGVDDSDVLNLDADECPEEVNIEYVLIHDSSGTELYRDEDFKE